MANAWEVKVAPSCFTKNADGTVLLIMSDGILGIVKEVMAVDLTETVDKEESPLPFVVPLALGMLSVQESSASNDI